MHALESFKKAGSTHIDPERIMLLVFTLRADADKIAANIDIPAEALAINVGSYLVQRLPEG